MVKMLTKNDREAILHAVAESEKRTSAEIVTIVSPASDAYQSYVLLYGFAMGSSIDFVLWLGKIATQFPLLLTLQLAMMSLLVFVPPLRRLALPLIPRRVRHHRAARRAYEEYLRASHHVSSSTPIVLLYVSLAEHYAHIQTSRLVREKIPDEQWKYMAQVFASQIKAGGLGPACVAAIEACTDQLAPHFPETGQNTPLTQHLVERAR